MINRLRLLQSVAALLLSPAVFSQISLPANTIVTENFNTIGSSATAPLPANWKMSSPGTGASATYGSVTNVTATSQAASSGLPSAAGRYNWATTAGTDRAIGFLTDAGYPSANAIMAYYRNTTGSAVNSITLSFSVERYVVNTATVSVALYYSTDGTTWIAQSNGDIGTADFTTGAAAGSFSTPKTITKAVGINVTVPNNGDIYFRWVFTNTGSTSAQGLGLDNVSVYAGAATPVLTAQLKDILQVDNGNQNQFNEGDVIRYQTVIKNIGSGAAGNVQLNIPPPSNTTLVGGSIKTSAVAIDDKYGTSFNTVLNGSSVLVNDFGVPAPTAVLGYGPTSDAALYSVGAAGTTDAGGAITLAANGTFTYTPPVGFSGVDYFKYIAGNGNLPNNDATVSITVAPDISFSTVNVNPLCNGGATGSITFNASGGAGTLQYSITGAGGTYQASNVFSGLSAGTYTLAVKDAVGYIKTGTATLTNPASIVVSGAIANGGYNTAITTATFSKTGGTGSIAWSASGLPTGVTINVSTGDVTGTPTQTGTFNAVITATDVNGCTGTKNVSFTVAPNLSPDTYNAVVGNTQLVADAHSAPATPFTASATNILSNDGSNSAITATAVTNAATTAGGTITIDAAGKFIYTPKNNYTGADSYTYTATSNGVSATATISFTVGSMVWYVNNNYAGANGAANGSSNRPYTDVASAEAASAASQIIYVHTGSGVTTGNAVLKAGQTLRGAGNSLTVGALSLGAGTKPTLSGTVTLANGVTVDGFDMNTGANPAITSSGATTVSVSVGNVTTSAATNAVTLNNTSGAVSIAGGTMSGGAGTVFNVSGGTANISCGASISQANAQRIINIANATGGTISFSGSITGSGSNTGINLATNTGATINFTGGITLNGTTSVFAATGGGTVNVTGATNTIGTTTVPTTTAITVSNTTIGTLGITFRSISANGATKAIVLNTTGTGGFTITGTGTTDGSGGTIQNISTRGIELINAANINLRNVSLVNANTVEGTSLDLDISNANGAIFLSNVNTILFDNVDINGSVQNGINGLNVSNFTMANSTITQAGNGANESGIEFSNLSGNCSITNSTINFSETNNLDIVNTDVSLTLTIDGCSFNDTQLQSTGGVTNTNGEGGVQFRSFSNLAGTPVSTITIKNSSFLRLRTQGIQAIAEDDTRLNIDITNCNINCQTDIGTGIDINGNDNAVVNFNIISNPLIQSRNGSAVNITSFLSSTVMGRVSNNSNITVDAIGSGVRAVAQETSRLIIDVRNNSINMGAANNSSPIDMQARFQSARIDITLANNLLNSEPSALADINITAGSSTAGETNQVYVNFIGNTVVAGGAPNVLRLRVSDLDASTNPLMFLQGFVEGGAGLDDDAVATWNANGNTPAATVANIAVSLTGTATAPSAGTAQLPTNPLP